MLTAVSPELCQSLAPSMHMHIHVCTRMYTYAHARTRMNMMNDGREAALQELLGPRMAASPAPSLCQLANFRQGPQIFLLPSSVVAMSVLGWGHGAGLHGAGAWVSGPRLVILSAGPCPKVFLLAGRLTPLPGTARAKVWAHLCGCREPQALDATPR